MEEISSSSSKVKELISLRSKIMAKLENCELGIAEAEFRYLEETDHGNIVKGFEGAQNRKTRVRSKDRIFSRSSFTAPLPEEEELPFQTQQRTMDAVLSMVAGRVIDNSTADSLLAAVVEEKVQPVTQTKRRRNTVAGALNVDTPPSTPPSAVKGEDSVPASAGQAAKRTSKRRKE